MLNWKSVKPNDYILDHKSREALQVIKVEKNKRRLIVSDGVYHNWGVYARDFSNYSRLG